MAPSLAWLLAARLLWGLGAATSPPCGPRWPNAFNTLLTPTCYSLGLAPMGDRAGTASAVMGFTSAAGGAVLAGLISARIEDTVTPMAVGYVIYGAAAVAFLVWAGRADTDAVPAEPSAPART